MGIGTAILNKFGLVTQAQISQIAKSAASEALRRVGAGEEDVDDFLRLLTGDVNPVEAPKQTVWVYRSVEFLTNELIQAPWRAMVPSDESDENGELPYVPAPAGHFLQILLQNPNPLQDASFFWKRAWTLLLLQGQVFLLIDRTNRLAPEIPNELWCFGKGQIAPRVDRGRLTGYYFPAGNREVTIPASEVVDLKFPHPASPWEGFSPISPVRFSVAGDEAATGYNFAFFENDATPGMALTVQGTLSDAAFKRTKAQWDQQHKGWKKAFKTAILEEGAKPERIALSQTDMQFIDGQKMNRDRIAAAFGVPTIFLADWSNSTYENVRTARKMAWTDAVLPLLRLASSAMSFQLGDEYPETRNGYVYPARVAPNLSEIQVLREDQKLQAEVLTEVVRAGVTVNDALAYVFRDVPIPDQPGGDRAWRPVSEVPVGSVSDVPGREPGKLFFLPARPKGRASGLRSG